MSPADASALPHLGDIFTGLKNGGHLCADDGPAFFALRDDASNYQKLFKALGFELVEHPRGFYYFKGDADLTKEATKIVVFFFVQVDAWGDQGVDLEFAAFQETGIRLDSLPHFTRPGWRTCLSEAEITDVAGLAAVVRDLIRLGFAERIDEETFRFRTPAWRLFDLCSELGRESEAAKAAEPEETP